NQHGLGPQLLRHSRPPRSQIILKVARKRRMIRKDPREEETCSQESCHDCTFPPDRQALVFVKLGRFYSWSVEIATRSCFASHNREPSRAPNELREAKLEKNSSTLFTTETRRTLMPL